MPDGNTHDLRLTEGDRRNGWYYDERGNLQKRPYIVEAHAEHCYERTPGCGDFTRITRRGFHDQDGSIFVALVDGWLPEGSDHLIAHHGTIYRLSTVRREAAAQAEAA